VVLGVGVGWLEEEFNALGVPFADRGTRHDDYVEAMRALWTQDKASVHNTYSSFDNCISKPAPVNGTVPIVVGGHTTRACKRAARLGDGFFPGSGGLRELEASFNAMRAECELIGRDPSEIELSAGGFGRTLDEMCTRVEQLQALGVNRVLTSPLPGDKLAELAAGLRTRFDVES